MNDTFEHSEGDLTAQLGLARGVVRAVRSESLEQGTDWKHVRGAVRYSEAGWAKLLLLLKISAPAARPPTPAAAPEIAGGIATVTQLFPGAQRQLVVAKIYKANPRIVCATFARPHDARVRVKSSANLVPGMAMACAWIEGDLWQLAQRLPRWRGKW